MNAHTTTPGDPATTRGLRLSVLRDGAPDATLNGVSADTDEVTVIGHLTTLTNYRAAEPVTIPTGWASTIPAASDSDRTVALRPRVSFTTKTRQIILDLVPASRDRDGNWIAACNGMSGGNYAVTSDSRLNALIAEVTDAPFYGALAIHDRFEH